MRNARCALRIVRVDAARREGPGRTLRRARCRLSCGASHACGGIRCARRRSAGPARFRVELQRVAARSRARTRATQRRTATRARSTTPPRPRRRFTPNRQLRTRNPAIRQAQAQPASRTPNNSPPANNAPRLLPKLRFLRAARRAEEAESRASARNTTAHSHASAAPQQHTQLRARQARNTAARSHAHVPRSPQRQPLRFPLPPVTRLRRRG